MLLLLAFCIFFVVPSSASAFESNGWNYDDDGYIIPDNTDIPSLRPDYINPDYQDLEWEYFINPSTMSLTEGGDYTVEESIKTTLMEYVTRNSSGTTITTGSFVFGSSYGWNVNSATFEISNSGAVLFESGGTLYLQINYASGTDTDGTLYIYRMDGSVESFAVQDTDGLVNNGTMNYFEVENSGADITKITLSCSSGSTDYGPYVGVSFVKYGYGQDEVVPEEDTSKNIFELLKDFIGGFSQTITNAITNAISNIFVPDEDFLKEHITSLKEEAWDSLGMLIYPIDFLSDIYEGIKNADADRGCITIPRLEWDGNLILEEQKFYLNDMFGKYFSAVQVVAKTMTAFALCLGFLGNLQDKYRRITDDN